MKTRIKFVIIFSFFTWCGYGSQGKESGKKFERAQSLYMGGNYADALTLFLELYKADSSNANICYKIGHCYLKSGRQNKNAVYYLQKAVKSVSSDYIDDEQKEKSAPLKAYKLLGDAYHLDYRFDDAIVSYQKYKQALINNKSDKDKVEAMVKKIRICKEAIEIVSTPIDIKIVNLGKEINSSYPDYSPRVSADQSTMIFTSRRPENTGGKTYDGGQYFEDIYLSKKVGAHWTPAVNIGWPINTVGNEAAIGLSADGQEMLIYKDDFGNGNIYSSCLEGDKWTTPVKLNSNINSEWWEPCAFISADGNTLFFVSDRPGGFGGTDIYKSKKTNGDWGPAINLGPTINSPLDEYAPFIHPDGVTLYFSSKGHKTMGGYDIFSSRTLLSDDKAWLEPVNVGYPVNSTGDDAFFMVSPDMKKAYYSSYRDNGLGEKDNYMILYPEPDETPISIIKGVVLDTNDMAAKNVIITITNNETSQSGIYRSNSQTGEYLVVLTPGNYNISYEAEGLLFYSLNTYVPSENRFNETNKDVKLSQISVGSKVTLNNIFFDFDQTKLRPQSKAELDKLYDILRRNPNLSVEVSGYADSRGTDEYNRKLSFERAEAVVAYLNSKGINRKRIIPAGCGVDKSQVEQKESDYAQQGLNPSGRRVELRITGIK